MFSFLQQAEVAYKWKGIIYPHLQECESLTQLLTVNTTNCQSFGAAVKDFPWSTAGEERDGQKAFFVWFLKARFFPRVTVTVVRELTTFCCLLGR